MKLHWFIFLLATMAAQAQSSFVARLDSTFMPLGNQQNLTLTITAPSNLSYDPHIELLDTCSFFAIVNQTPWIKTQNGNTNISEKKIRFSIFDEGAFTLPVVYAVAGSDTIKTFPLIINIGGIQVDTSGLKPIKGIIREKTVWTDYLIYIIPLVLLVVGYLVYRWYWKRMANRQTQIIEVPVSKPLPHEVAFMKLNELKKSKLWERDVKEFHSQLTFILREYLEGRYEVPALESTSNEIIRDIHKVNDLDKSYIATIDKILNIADWVKFAKGIPEADANAQALDQTIDLVEKTKYLPPVQTKSSETVIN